MGWDAFGLPTENYAIQNHIHPKIVTKNANALSSSHIFCHFCSTSLWLYGSAISHLLLYHKSFISNTDLYKEASGKIKAIAPIVLEGTTHYYICLENSEDIFDLP